MGRGRGKLIIGLPNKNRQTIIEIPEKYLIIRIKKSYKKIKVRLPIFQN